MVVTTLAENGHAGELCEVSGPDLLSFDDMVAELSNATCRRGVG